MAGCEDVWPRFYKALGAYPQRLQCEDVWGQAGNLVQDVVQYLRDANARVALTCPPSARPLRQEDNAMKALQQSCN